MSKHHWNKLGFCYDCKCSQKDYIDYENYCGEDIKAAIKRRKQKQEWLDTIRALGFVK